MSPKQHRAMELLMEEHPDMVFSLLYGGAKGGGKSVFLSQFSFLYPMMLAKEYGLQPQSDLRKIPIVGFLGRKIGKHFNETTLLTWKREIPGEYYQLRMLEGKVPIIVLDNRIGLMYGGMDNTETLKKFNSAELMFFAVDQAEEMEEQDYAMLRGTLRLQLGPSAQRHPPKRGYKALLSANPAECFLKRDFVTARTRKPGNAFLQALPSDNPFLPPGYIESLKQTYSFNPALLNAYLHGSWEDLDQAFVVIPRRRIEACINNKTVNKVRLKKLTAADIAGESESSDESVIGNFENEELLPNWEIYSHRDLMDTAGRIISHALKNGSTCIVIDKVGEGAGVYSRVQEVIQGHNQNLPPERRIYVHGFDGRLRPPPGIPEQTYLNYKAYAWFTASQGVIAERKTSIPADEELVRQLCGTTYRFTSNGKMALDPKDQIKEKLGCSPDRADMFVMGLDGIQHAKVIQVRDRYAEDDRTKTYRWSPDSV